MLHIHEVDNNVEGHRLESGAVVDARQWQDTGDVAGGQPIADGAVWVLEDLCEYSVIATFLRIRAINVITREDEN